MKKKLDATGFREEEDLPKNLGKGVMIAYGILLLHLLLFLVIGFVVLFLRGLFNYISLLILAGFLLTGLFVYLGFRKFKKGRTRLEDILRNPDFADRNLEIRLLGGLASLRMGEEKESSWKEIQQKPLMLESPQSSRIRELTELGTMYEKKLLTLEEYEMAKKEVLKDLGRDNNRPVLVEFANTPKDAEVE